jgi:transposase-like protein
MANSVIPVETKIKVMQECLRLVDMEAVAARHGVSSRAIYGWYTEKI